VLLVTIDTLRADRVGAYGHRAAQTPHLDRLSREGVLVADAVVQTPQTRPSHASLFTGRQPYEHGIRDNFSPPLEPGVPTLAELLRKGGYHTAGFIGAYPVSRDSGLDRGFDRFDDPFSGTGPGHQELRSERRATEVVDRALEWLSDAPAPFFAWVHLFDPHAPYRPPPPYRSRFADEPYDGEVAYSDAQVGRLLGWLDAAGRRDSTLVVVTSDHGEGLGEHGEDEHLFFVYDSTLRVPLLLRWPGRLPAGVRVSGQFRSVDLLPTLLDLAGQPPVATSGESRAETLRTGGRIPDNESYAESLYGQLRFGYAPLRALRADGWKYIDAPRAELYHLGSDPGETRNRLDDSGPLAAAMRDQLRGYDAGEASAAGVTLDPEANERLAALGYVGGGFFMGPPSGADPKDKIAEFQEQRRQVSRAVTLFREGDYDAVVGLLRPLTGDTVNDRGQRVERRSFNVSFYLGRALLELGRFTEAEPPLADAAAINPKMAAGYLYLSNAQAGAGKTAEALTTVERGIAIAPRSAELQLARGRLLLEEGRVAEAQEAFEWSRSIDVEQAATRVALADLYRQQGKLERARVEAEEAVRLAAESAAPRIALGLVLGAQGCEQTAAEVFREALRLEPDQPDALFFLAAVEARGGRAADAIPLLEQLLQQAPDYPGGRELLARARSMGAPPPEGAVRLRLIRVESRDRAEAARRRIASGEAFAAVARELSEDPSARDGGDLGTVRLSDLASPLRSAAAGLAPGEVSGVLATGQGFFILGRER
jgi:arylsulfatase A-like enzyme/parvulin-like peptidyl-prolyl isomerase